MTILNIYRLFYDKGQEDQALKKVIEDIIMRKFNEGVLLFHEGHVTLSSGLDISIHSLLEKSGCPTCNRE